MIAGYELHVLLIMGAAFLVAGGIKGVIGVGTPLVVVPVGALLLPPTIVLSFLIVPIIAANAYQYFSSDLRKDSIRRFWPAATAQLIATTITTQFLIRIDPDNLKLMLGVAISFFALLQVIRVNVDIAPRHERFLQVGTGAMAGGIGGVTGFQGPLLMVMLFTLKIEKDMFVTAMAMFFLVSYLPMFATLSAASILGWQELVISLAATVPLVLGIKFGERFRKRVSQELFRKLIAAMLVIIGCNLIWIVLSAS